MKTLSTAAVVSALLLIAAPFASSAGDSGGPLLADGGTEVVATADVTTATVEPSAVVDPTRLNRGLTAIIRGNTLPGGGSVADRRDAAWVLDQAPVVCESCTDGFFELVRRQAELTAAFDKLRANTDYAENLLSIDSDNREGAGRPLNLREQGLLMQYLDELPIQAGLIRGAEDVVENAVDAYLGCALSDEAAPVCTDGLPRHATSRPDAPSVRSGLSGTTANPYPLITAQLEAGMGEWIAELLARDPQQVYGRYSVSDEMSATGGIARLHGARSFDALLAVAGDVSIARDVLTMLDSAVGSAGDTGPLDTGQ